MNLQLNLYKEVILEHNRKPRNFGKMENPSFASEGYNPLCGDHLWIYLKSANEDVIDAVSFDGAGCAISKASASMMTVAIKGKSLAEAKAVFEEFHNLLQGKLDPEKQENRLGSLKIFANIWHYPSRVKCAALAWRTLQGALAKQQQVSTEGDS